VDVRLLLPGVIDVPVVRHAGHGHFADLLASGVRIFEYQRAVLHAKTLVADDYVTLVWSSNLDFRCFHFNAECNVVILDDEIGRRMAHRSFAGCADNGCQDRCGFSITATRPRI
jgi:cardiolipin synthase